MPRKKNWKVSQARKYARQRQAQVNNSDSQLIAADSEGVSHRSDGGLAHPHKPSDAQGVSLKSDGGLARPHKPPDAFDVMSVSEMCLNSLIDLKMNLSDQCNKETKTGFITEEENENVIPEVSHPLINTVTQTGVEFLSGLDFSESYLIHGDMDSYGAKEQNYMHNRNVLETFKKHTVIFGSFHQADNNFSIESRGNQCTANAICSMIYANIAQLS
ncbi:hypothetical protein DPMN_063761 [Dreissena polymorpha]|uniref:Uncharacterized protein n=1 Tax=Dreissena polymorpha TaxID=45954 RepID=A0A9D4CB48_DREPO|nr:hypothetical protein DPMN_063761 [Dreissena polymorpha]